MRPPDGKIDQDALREVLHEYRHCTEDEARAIIGHYLDAVERAEQRRRDEELANEWRHPSFTHCDPTKDCEWCDERREAWERLNPEKPMPERGIPDILRRFLERLRTPCTCDYIWKRRYPPIGNEPCPRHGGCEVEGEPITDA